jgi:hypothetical protein
MPTSFKTIVAVFVAVIAAATPARAQIKIHKTLNVAGHPDDI